MKPDPYAHIRAALTRRVGGTIVKPLPLPILHPIVLDKRRRSVKIAILKSTTPTNP